MKQDVVCLVHRCSINMSSFPSSLNLALEYILNYVNDEKPWLLLSMTLLYESTTLCLFDFAFCFFIVSISLSMRELESYLIDQE